MVKQADVPAAKALIDALLESSKINTIRSVFERIEPDPEDLCIRTSMSPAATETGRLSHSETFLEKSTNLGNLPKTAAKLDPMFDVRSCIVPRPGQMLHSADYSSAEHRLLAYLADEQRAIRQIENGINDYKWFAARLYGIDDWRDIVKSDPKYAVGKMAILAFERGVGWKTFKDQVNSRAELTGAIISAAQSKEAERLFHSLYPGFRQYHERVGQTIRQKGFLVNVIGRKRVFFGRKSNWDAIVREGVSFLAQATADVLNARMVELYEQHDPELLRLLLQVHDEIVYETDLQDWRQAAAVVKETLEQPVNLLKNAPTPTAVAEIVIPADVAVSTESWAAVKEVA